MSKLYGILSADGGPRENNGQRSNVDRTKRAHQEIIATAQSWHVRYQLALSADGTCWLRIWRLGQTAMLVELQNVTLIEPEGK